MASYRDAAKERFWRRAVRGWERSGLTIRDYCCRQDLAEHSFHAWRRELARRDRPAQDHGGKPAAFVPVVLQEDRGSEAGAAIEIELGNGRWLRVRPGFDAATLTQVVTLLEEGRAC
jgi:transposase